MPGDRRTVSPRFFDVSTANVNIWMYGGALVGAPQCMLSVITTSESSTQMKPWWCKIIRFLSYTADY
jgi:hypothetical protein